MIANKILEILLLIFSFIIIPLQIVTTFILGLLVTITFGLLLFPISAIWIICFLTPLIGLSYVYEKVHWLRVPVAIIGIPIAILGYSFSTLMPSMGETQSRVSKLLLCNIFPYTWHCYQYTKANALLPITDGYYSMIDLFTNYASKSGSLWRDYVIHLQVNYEVQMELRKERINKYLQED